MRLRHAALIVLLALSAGRHAAAAEDVLVGAIYPGTAGGAKAAIETALEIVNGTHDPVSVLMGRGGGLDRLGGARLRIVFADDNGDPAKAAAEAERLVSNEHVVALIGGASDATAASISEVAERHALPHLSFDAPATALSQRDLNWFFRVGASRSMTAEILMRFVAERKAQSVALVSDHGADGREFSRAMAKLAEAASIKVAADLKLAVAGSAAAEAAAVFAAKPDAVLPSLDLAEALLLVRGLADAKSGVPIVASGGGFLSREFLDGLGQQAEGVFTVAGFAADAIVARPAIPAVNAAFRARTGRDLDEAAARELVGTLLLADVIDRAGTTKPNDLRIALMATDTPGEETLMAWQGIRFDTTGQNVLATPAVQQVQSGAWATVYPERIAVTGAK